MKYGKGKVGGTGGELNPYFSFQRVRHCLNLINQYMCVHVIQSNGGNRGKQIETFKEIISEMR